MTYMHSQLAEAFETRGDLAGASPDRRWRVLVVAHDIEAEAREGVHTFEPLPVEFRDRVRALVEADPANVEGGFVNLQYSAGIPAEFSREYADTRAALFAWLDQPHSPSQWYAAERRRLEEARLAKQEAEQQAAAAKVEAGTYDGPTAQARLL